MKLATMKRVGVFTLGAQAVQFKPTALLPGGSSCTCSSTAAATPLMREELADYPFELVKSVLFEAQDESERQKAERADPWLAWIRGRRQLTQRVMADPVLSA